MTCDRKGSESVLSYSFSLSLSLCAGVVYRHPKPHLVGLHLLQHAHGALPVMASLGGLDKLEQGHKGLQNKSLRFGGFGHYGLGRLGFGPN